MSDFFLTIPALIKQQPDARGPPAPPHPPIHRRTHARTVSAICRHHIIMRASALILALAAAAAAAAAPAGVVVKSVDRDVSVERERG